MRSSHVTHHKVQRCRPDLLLLETRLLPGDTVLGLVLGDRMLEAEWFPSTESFTVPSKRRVATFDSESTTSAVGPLVGPTNLVATALVDDQIATHRCAEAAVLRDSFDGRLFSGRHLPPIFGAMSATLSPMH